jgi:hypothetical protein
VTKNYFSIKLKPLAFELYFAIFDVQVLDIFFSFQTSKIILSLRDSNHLTFDCVNTISYRLQHMFPDFFLRDPLAVKKIFRGPKI